MTNQTRAARPATGPRTTTIRDARLDDIEWERLGVRFLQLFHRPPSKAELVLFRSTRAGLQLRLPAPRRQRLLVART